jgi:hypothetical protein
MKAGVGSTIRRVALFWEIFAERTGEDLSPNSEKASPNGLLAERRQ